MFCLRFLRWPQVCRDKITFESILNKLIRFYKNELDEMPCKLDSSEYAGSFLTKPRTNPCCNLDSLVVQAMEDALSSTAVPTDKVKVEVKNEIDSTKKTTRNPNTAKEGGKGDIDSINLISEDEDADGGVQDESGGMPGWLGAGIDGGDNDREGTFDTQKRPRQPAHGQQQQQAQKPKESVLHQQLQQEQVWAG